MDTEAIKHIIKERYGKAALAGGGCCSLENSTDTHGFATEHALYTPEELAGVPMAARSLSRGCGNPTGFADLKLGEIVVDIGCGAGIDVILAAQKVIPGGKAIGVDFSEDMINRAREAVANAKLGQSVELLI